MSTSRRLARPSTGQRAAAWIAVFVAVTFLTGGHCGDEMTAPQTPTRLLSPRRVPPHSRQLSADSTPTSCRLLCRRIRPPRLPSPLRRRCCSRPKISGFVYVAFVGGVAPVNGASITVRQDAFLKSAVTDASGRFLLSGLHSGPASVSAKSASRSKFVAVVLHPGTNTISINMRQERRVRPPASRNSAPRRRRGPSMRPARAGREKWRPPGT